MAGRGRRAIYMCKLVPIFYAIWIKVYSVYYVHIYPDRPQKTKDLEKYPEKI